ncbi:MAG: hypothetical protein AAFN40_15160 [Cyanobacteria bacterium J06560_6]
MPSDLRDEFPNLYSTEHQLTSPRDDDYNCIAWAAEENDRWWSPQDDYYWPEGILAEWTVEAVIQAFVSLGYELCESADYEPNFQKIAIYKGTDGDPTHAARQLPNGKWTSKLGDWEDIEHTLPGIEGEKYGKVCQIMKRVAPKP